MATQDYPSFENFPVGEDNEMAFQAAVSITKTVGERHSFLYLFGSSGVEKTHLVQAILNRLWHTNYMLDVASLTAKQFFIEYTSAVRWNLPDGFKSRFYNLDVLVIEDIQYLEKKTFSQLALLNILKSLELRNAQVVFTSDRAPSMLRLAWSGLRSRMNSDSSIGVGMAREKAEALAKLRVACERKLNEMEKRSDQVQGTMKESFRRATLQRPVRSWAVESSRNQQGNSLPLLVDTKVQRKGALPVPVSVVP